MIGATDRELFPEYGEGYEQRDSDAIASSVSQVHESIFTRDDGEAVHLRTVRKLLDGPDRPNQYILGISEDVTQIRRKEAEVLHLAQHDALTGLFNRATFTDRLHHMVQDGKAFAMLSIDLDRFRPSTTSLATRQDAVLIQVGERLACLVEQGDWVARVGGDEFCRRCRAIGRSKG
jgi:predicted signal transduction protein with EAL and GGDEF domain